MEINKWQKEKKNENDKWNKKAKKKVRESEIKRKLIWNKN